jgi:hypothetical protein
MEKGFFQPVFFQCDEKSSGQIRSNSRQIQSRRKILETEWTLSRKGRTSSLYLWREKERPPFPSFKETK